MEVSKKELKNFDPVFLKYGQYVYSNEYIEKLREENLKKKKDGKPVYNLIPQKGFQEDALLIDADIKIEGGKRGLGKVLTNDSDIITPFGIRKNGDLKVGDIISNPVTGGMEKVIAIYEHPHHDFYEVQFDDGSTVQCGLEHLWKVRKGGEGYRIYTFGEIKQLLDEGADMEIPLTAPVDFNTPADAKDIRFASREERQSFVDVCTQGTLGYCTDNKETAETLAFVARSLGYWVKIQKGRNYEVFVLKRDSKKIVGYKHIGIKDGRCITVDDVNSLYMTNDFIVTHNTWLALFEALPYIFNPDVNMYVFRKFEDDVKRGPWKASKPVFRGFGTPAVSNFEWTFLGGKGATLKMEHLQDEKKIKDRFRGVEMAYIDIEELAEHTRDSMAPLFDLLTSNRSTAGVQPKCVCTCNPVGKSNKLRYFVDWWIDPETNKAIPERNGKIRYFFRSGDDVREMIWGDTPKEVYEHPAVKDKVQKLCKETGLPPEKFVTSVTFISGSFSDNKVLQVSDPKYMSRISAKGGESTTNDIEGVWADVDTGSSIVSIEDMEAFFSNPQQNDNDEILRASGDVALVGDFLVLWAAKGRHIIDVEGVTGIKSDNVIPIIEQFLSRNGVHKENFTFDENGLGIWLREARAMSKCVGFNNKSAPSDSRLWNNLKSECADKFCDNIINRKWSIEEKLVYKMFTDAQGNRFNLYDRLMAERLALKRKDDVPRWEIISKQQMKLEIGHSPDFIEGLFMMESLFKPKTNEIIRRGFEYW